MSVAAPVRRGEEVVLTVGRVEAAVAITGSKGCLKDVPSAPSLVRRTAEIASLVTETGTEPGVTGSKDEVASLAGLRRPLK